MKIFCMVHIFVIAKFLGNFKLILKKIFENTEN